MFWSFGEWLQSDMAVKIAKDIKIKPRSSIPRLRMATFIFVSNNGLCDRVLFIILIS